MKSKAWFIVVAAVACFGVFVAGMFSLVMLVIGMRAKAELVEQMCSDPSLVTQVDAAGVSLTGQLTVRGLPLKRDQEQIAKNIIGIAMNRKGDFPTTELQERAAVIAITAGIVESSLRNLPKGDRDSLGIFQMRPSQGWGTPEQILDTTYSINKFYDVMVEVDDWQTKLIGDVAQAVERSRFPSRYAQYVGEATQIVSHATGDDSITTSDIGDMDTSICEELTEQQTRLDAIIEAARSQDGNPYSWANPFDGVSFVDWAYSKGQVTLPDSMKKLLVYTGDEGEGVSTEWISRQSLLSGDEELQPGDAIFFSDGAASPSQSNITRVGIYLGQTLGEMKVGSFNVLGASHTTGQAWPWSRRLPVAIKAITSHKLDIVGFQELQGVQYQALKHRLGKEFSFYPATHIKKGQATANSIMWRSDRFKLIKSGVIPGMKYFGGMTLRAPWVLLEDRTTGSRFYMLNTHDPAFPRSTKLRYKNALAEVRFLKSLQSTGYPVVFSGDFNGGYVVNRRNAVYQGVSSNLTYNILTRSGLVRDSYNALHGPGAMPRNRHTIDHIYVSSDIDVTSYGTYGTYGRHQGYGINGSDHPLVYVTLGAKAATSKDELGQWVGPTKNGSEIAIQSVEKTALTGVLRPTFSSPTVSANGQWVLPLEKSTYTVTSTYGWSYSAARGGYSFHDGTDLSAAIGTPVYAMHDGVVYSAGYSGAAGNQVIVRVKGDTLGYKYEHLSNIVPGITPGTVVKAGQLTGYVGSTGNSTGSHLHVSICTNVPLCVLGSGAQGKATVNPVPFLESLGLKVY